MKALLDRPIRAFAVVCVAVIAIYLMVMGNKVIATLSGPGWCKAALGAEKASSTDGTIKGLDACVGLFTVQLRSLANVAYIYSGALALCLVTLIVIVVAGAHLAGKFNKDGGELDLGPGAAPTPVKVVNTPAQAVPVEPHAAVPEASPKPV